ncbi:GTPase HflX [Candidatus Dehalogenimonas loeffleri]|uniref:GTPase HflX n=1 Tax=Candidatus Dehalogenimonas loeffleri TaxID=3127115 RepID=A0ABZ2J613_9CHLR
MKKASHSTSHQSERGVLVALDLATTRTTSGWDSQDSLDELENLVKTAGGTVVGRLTQRLPKPLKTTYLGKGKLEELVELKQSLNYETVIFDDELSPLQQRVLEATLQVKVIDRVAVILDIFAKHAETREGRLQVELAQHEYLLPRLAGQWSHLERLGAGIGTRGPGESQLETDRRLIQRKIVTLKHKLDDVSNQRELYRSNRRRQGIPVVALVGYTNSGKSSLLKALTKADVIVQDKIFATLDPTTRRISLPGNRQVLLTDTVGFINKLPPAVVNAFNATLEELQEASIIVHVIDIAAHNAPEHCQTVESVLSDLKISQKPRITVYNKIDLLPGVAGDWDEAKALNELSAIVSNRPDNTVLTSTVKRWGLSDLMETIAALISSDE